MGGMDEKRSHDARDWKEGRRLRAWELSQAGWKQAAVAEALGVTGVRSAPDLNPAEGIWRHLKWVELKNVCCRDLDHLRAELRKAKERLHHKKHIIQACIRQPGYV
jgi:transposase